MSRRDAKIDAINYILNSKENIENDICSSVVGDSGADCIDKINKICNEVDIIFDALERRLNRLEGKK